MAREWGDYAIIQGVLVVDQPEAIQLSKDWKAVMIDELPSIDNKAWAALLALVLRWERPVFITTQQLPGEELLRFCLEELQGVRFYCRQQINSGVPMYPQ